MSRKQSWSESIGRGLGVLAVAALIVAAVMGLWMGLSYARTEAAKMSVDPAEKSVYRGETFEVMVRIDGADPIQGFDFRLAWDPDVVTVETVEPAGAFAVLEDYTFTPTGPGELFFGATFLDGTTVPGTGPLAKVTLKTAQGDVGGETDLELFEPNALDEDFQPVMLNDGDGDLTVIAVEVAPAYPAQWVTAGTTFTEVVRIHGGDPLNGFEFRLEWDDAVIDVTDIEPAGAFADVEDFTSNQVGAEEWFFGATFTDGSTALGTGDLALVHLEARETGFSPLTLFDVLTIGEDLMGDAVAPEAVGQGEIHVAESQVWVEPAETKAMVGDTVTVDVKKDSDQALGLYQFYVTWNPAQLTFEDAGPGMDVDGTFTSTLTAPGTLRVVGLAETHDGVVGAGEQALAELTFEVLTVGTADVDVVDVAEAVGAPGPEGVQLFDTGLDLLPAPQVIDGIVDATKRAVAFGFDAIADQMAGEPFEITLRAMTEDDTLAYYSGTADLSDSTGTLSPTEADFTNGLATLEVTITDGEDDVTISASATDTVPDPNVLIEGISNAFDVTLPLDEFVFLPMVIQD